MSTAALDADLEHLRVRFATARWARTATFSSSRSTDSSATESIGKSSDKDQRKREYSSTQTPPARILPAHPSEVLPVRLVLQACTHKGRRSSTASAVLSEVVGAMVVRMQSSILQEACHGSFRMLMPWRAAAEETSVAGGYNMGGETTRQGPSTGKIRGEIGNTKARSGCEERQRPKVQGSRTGSSAGEGNIGWSVRGRRTQREGWAWSLCPERSWCERARDLSACKRSGRGIDLI